MSQVTCWSVVDSGRISKLVDLPGDQQVVADVLSRAPVEQPTTGLRVGSVSDLKDGSS